MSLDQLNICLTMIASPCTLHLSCYEIGTGEIYDGPTHRTDIMMRYRT
jgi:nitrite reductase/ring-hydroxylating ferredoxin subunit